MLVHTLDALLKENGNGLKAAQRLGLHRNTINQRIQRIEQLSGQSLDDPLFRMNASVAMLVWRMSEDPGKGNAMNIINARLRGKPGLFRIELDGERIAAIGHRPTWPRWPARRGTPSRTWWWRPSSSRTSTSTPPSPPVSRSGT
jgi:hypothetical protein